MNNIVYFDEQLLDFAIEYKAQIKTERTLNSCPLSFV